MRAKPYIKDGVRNRDRFESCHTTCFDAGGGPPRVGKFPRSMSDFKPGEKLWSMQGKLATFVYNGQAIGCPELTATPASAGFIMDCNEIRGSL